MAPRKKTTTKKATAKKNIDSMEYTDGKFESIEDKHKKATDIEELLSVPKNPFGTNSFDDLEEKLEGMNLRQMQEMAVKASVFPSGNKTSLKNKIRREFKMKFGSKDGGKRYNSSSDAPILDPDSKIAQEVIQLLNGK